MSKHHASDVKQGIANKAKAPIDKVINYKQIREFWKVSAKTLSDLFGMHWPHLESGVVEANEETHQLILLLSTPIGTQMFLKNLPESQKKIMGSAYGKMLRKAHKSIEEIDKKLSFQRTLENDVFIFSKMNPFTYNLSRMIAGDGGIIHSLSTLLLNRKKSKHKRCPVCKMENGCAPLCTKNGSGTAGAGGPSKTKKTVIKSSSKKVDKPKVTHTGTYRYTATYRKGKNKKSTKKGRKK